MIKLAAFDFDGTFTNGEIIFHENIIVKKYNVKDGYGIKLLKKKGIKTCVISGYKYNDSMQKICEHLNIDHIYQEIENKAKCIDELLKELNLNYEEVSFMGDDLNDFDLLKKVNLSGCPKNSNSKIIDECKFISNYNGGNGAVREFCEHICSNPISVSGLICVKYFSKRFPGKNFVKFGNKTLLNNKIDMLLSLKFLNEVVINTESDEIIDIVKKDYSNNHKVRVVKRDKKFSLETTESVEFCKEVASKCLYDNILYCPITCPLIRYDTYNLMYDNYVNNDCVVLISDGLKGTGHSGEIHNFCFGSSLLSKKDMINNGDTICENYYIQECNRIEKIDIDYYNDYKRALYYYYNNNEQYNENIIQHLSHPLYSTTTTNNNHNNNNNVKILDCTVRDGGFVNNWNYKYEDVLKMIKIDGNIGIDYYEVGYLMNDELLDESTHSLWRNCSFRTINNIRKDTNVKCKISVMIDHWRYDFNKLPESSVSGIDLIRICSYIENIEGVYDTCKKLKIKGYEVSINIIASSYLTHLDLTKIKSYMMTEDYVDWYYFADSFGSMTPENIENIILFYKNDPRTSHIKIGIHCHNNCQIALCNTIKAIECGADMIDGTYCGEGRGGGNLPLENILLYLKIKHNYNLNLDNLLEFLPELYKKKHIDPYIIRETISGLMNVHPYRLKKYDNNLDLLELYNNLKDLPMSKKKDYKL
tara:strand:+ start:7754 stop:9859 length:2106 start_codon:yes stop_codon:yes gene_type:complete